MTYLPPIYNLVHDMFEDELFVPGPGPVCIILCMSSKKVAEVTGICRRFANESKVAIVSACGMRDQLLTQVRL